MLITKDPYCKCDGMDKKDRHIKIGICLFIAIIVFSIIWIISIILVSLEPIKYGSDKILGLIGVGSLLIAVVLGVVAILYGGYLRKRYLTK